MTNEAKTNSRSEAAKKAWITRRAKKAALPVCLCGCGTILKAPAKPSQKRNYCQGHDARLRGKILAVIAGKADISTIPAALFERRNEIAFLSDPKFAPLFSKTIKAAA